MDRRVSWIDTAKGLSIILVVYSHSITAVDDLEMPHKVIGAINYWLRDIRMPLFMLVSGILASGVLARSWGALWRRRLANLLWIYAIWTVIIAAAYLPTNEAQALIPQFYAPNTQLWYIAALAIYLPATKVLSPLGKSMSVAVALCIHLMAQLLPGQPFVYETSARMFIFFVIGATYAPTILQSVAQDRIKMSVIGFLGVGICLAMKQEMGVTVFGVMAAFGLAAVAAERLPRLSTAMGAIGQRTLPIFCLHGIFLAFLSQIGASFKPFDVPGLALWGVLAFTALSMVFSLAAYAWLSQITVLWRAPDLPSSPAEPGPRVA